jgi:phosphoglycerate dehydrogenase-like enzyme
MSAISIFCFIVCFTDAKPVALIYEDPAFIAKVQSHLVSDYELIPLTASTSLADIARAEAVVGDVPAALLKDMPALKFWQSVGFVTPLEYRQRPDIAKEYPGLKICRGGGIGAVYARTIAEWILAASLELVFKLGQTTKAMTDCAWSESSPNCPIHSTFGTRPALMNMTLGIVGYGKVGQQVSEISSALFGKVVASDIAATGDAPSPLAWWTTDNNKVLQAADVIVLAFNDHINATVGLISAASFKVMKPGAQLVMFVGSLGVDEKAAYDAVASGALGGIAINQWWERWAWRPPRDSAKYLDSEVRFTQ